MHPANTTQWLAQIDDVIASGPFDATWESLKAYEIPKWYEDDKFGIFIHWGVYCVPAFSNEWYARNMYQEGSKEFEHHVKTYGPHDRFGYKDFIPMFKAEKFDPMAWAELFREAGAKFVVPVAEHHDGFAMYDSGFTDWCAARMGPKRDTTGELAKAVRDLGMTFGASSHRAEHFWFFDGGRKFPSDVQDPAYDGLYGPAQPGPQELSDTQQNPPTDEYMQDWLARTCEIVDKYQPQIVWFDWWIQNVAFKPYLQKFAAYYYNRAAQWGKGVAINYKYNAFEEGTAVFDVERGQLSAIRPQLWQNDTSVSKNSWCYIEGHEYKEVGSLVEDLVDVVSKNGALLLNIGPKPDGTIPEHEQQMLRAIGAWLKVNGEAIYGSRPWKTFGEGPTDVPEGAFTDTNRAAFTAQDIRFTTKGSDLYAVALAWPGETLTIKSLATGSELAPAQIGSVTLLGNDGALAWTRDAEGLKVTMPAEKPCDFAYVVKIGGAAG